MDFHKDRLYAVFAKSFITFNSDLLHEVYSLLFNKMLNLRIKDMEKSWERLEGNTVTLNLRDELKPFAKYTCTK